MQMGAAAQMLKKEFLQKNKLPRSRTRGAHPIADLSGTHAKDGLHRNLEVVQFRRWYRKERPYSSGPETNANDRVGRGQNRVGRRLRTREDAAAQRCHLH